ncbi:MAG TPA: RES family NAD+ phosphorylase [Solirubrobacterales bacterium]|nr:RES family NAD+ phosphorylase [Solirubrobacterales bacterium]
MPTSRELRRRLEELPRRNRSLDLWRAAGTAYDLLATRGARLHGGRWNPPGLAVLYASLEPETVRAERVRAAELRGMPESALYPLRLGRVALRGPVVDLSRQGAAEKLGFDAPFSILTPLAQSRAVGAAAAKLPVAALLVPSVTGAGTNAVIYPERAAEGPEITETKLLRSARGWP